MPWPVCVGVLACCCGCGLRWSVSLSAGELAGAASFAEPQAGQPDAVGGDQDDDRRAGNPARLVAESRSR